jgi:hypothetical protein
MYTKEKYFFGDQNEYELSDDGKRLFYYCRVIVDPEKADRSNLYSKDLQDEVKIIDTEIGTEVDKFILRTPSQKKEFSGISTIRFSNDYKQVMLFMDMEMESRIRDPDRQLITINFATNKITPFTLQENNKFQVAYAWNDSKKMVALLREEKNDNDRIVDLNLLIYKDGIMVKQSLLQERVGIIYKMFLNFSPDCSKLALCIPEHIENDYPTYRGYTSEQDLKPAVMEVYGVLDVGFVRSPSASRVLPAQKLLKNETDKLLQKEAAEMKQLEDLCAHKQDRIKEIQQRYKKQRDHIHLDDDFRKREYQKATNRNLKSTMTRNIGTLRGLSIRPPGAFGANDPGGKKFEVPDGWIDSAPGNRSQSPSPVAKKASPAVGSKRKYTKSDRQKCPKGTRWSNKKNACVEKTKSVLDE